MPIINRYIFVFQVIGFKRYINTFIEDPRERDSVKSAVAAGAHTHNEQLVASVSHILLIHNKHPTTAALTFQLQLLFK